MSREFNTVPPDMMADFLIGNLSPKEEKRLLLRVTTLEDLWVLAQMKAVTEEPDF